MSGITRGVALMNRLLDRGAQYQNVARRTKLMKLSGKSVRGKALSRTVLAKLMRLNRRAAIRSYTTGRAAMRTERVLRGKSPFSARLTGGMGRDMVRFAQHLQLQRLQGR